MKRMADFVRQAPYRKEYLKFISHYGVLEVAGLEVELMGDIQHRLPDGSWSPAIDVSIYRRWVTWEGRQVPVLDLAYEAQAYAEIGREAKAALIRAALAKRQ
jgi:hypothetical protein